MDTEARTDRAVTDAEPGAVAPADDIEPGPPTPTANRPNGRAWLSVGLVSAAGLLRSRRFQGQVIIGVIGLAALVALARENQARIVASLIAWDKRQELRVQHRARNR